MWKVLRNSWLNVAVVTATSVVLVWLVARSSNRDSLSTFGSYVAAVLGPAFTLIAHIIKQNDPDKLTRSLRKTADLLASEVKTQWDDAAGRRQLRAPIPVAWRRSCAPIAAPVAVAVGSLAFAPLPGLSPVRREQLDEGELKDLYALYGGLGSGRLVITGPPGSGKSGAAICLILEALRRRALLDRRERSQVPVPVLFTLRGWNPNTEDFRNWLARQLQIYPFLSGQRGLDEARKLVSQGKIAAILDGFDEIPVVLQAVALRALSDCATFRVVLLARTEDMTAAASSCIFAGAAALELQEVSTGQASEYLTIVQRDPPPDHWRDLTERLRGTEDAAIGRALNSPLTLTLVRDLYLQSDNVGELLSFCDSDTCTGECEHVENFLLGHRLRQAYRPRPGETACLYDAETAERALRRLATLMNSKGTRDLEWWTICSWTSWIPRRIATCLVLAAVFAAVGSGVGGVTEELGAGWQIGLASGALLGLCLRGGGRTPLQAPDQWWWQMFRLKSVSFGPGIRAHRIPGCPMGGRPLSARCRVNGQVAVPAGGQLKVPTPRVDHLSFQGGSSSGSGLAHAV
jgi:hypothetical protein